MVLKCPNVVKGGHWQSRKILMTRASSDCASSSSSSSDAEDDEEEELCWRLPEINPDDNSYFEDYDECSFSENIRMSDKFAFLEEAKEFFRNIKQMSQKPIIPAARFFAHQLEQDKQRFNKMEAEIETLDTQYEKSLQISDSTFQAIDKCSGMDQVQKSCPRWKEWTEWLSCKSECEQRGTVRERGCVLDGRDVDSDNCARDSGNTAFEYKKCYDSEICPPEHKTVVKERNKYAYVVKSSSDCGRHCRYGSRCSACDSSTIGDGYCCSYSDCDSSSRKTALESYSGYHCVGNPVNTRKEYYAVHRTHTRSCLAADDFATFCNGTKVEMKKLRRGDLVKSFDLEMRSQKCGKIVGMVDHSAELQSFLEIQTDRGSFTLSQTHLAYLHSPVNEIYPARSILKGMSLLGGDGKKVVVKEIKRRNVFPISPQVENGIIIVNDHVVSTLTITDYIFTKPLLPILEEFISRQPSENQDELFQKVVEISREFFRDCDKRILRKITSDKKFLTDAHDICISVHDEIK